jgi:hypothetical protein
MKTIAIPIIVIALTTFSTVTFAQVEKGSWIVGGAMSFSRVKRSYQIPTYGAISRAISFSISPDLLYFPIDRLAVGLYVPFTHSATLGLDPNSKNTSIALGPSIRYYLRLSENCFLFPEVSYNYGWYINKGMQYDRASQELFYGRSVSTQNSFKVGGGVTYFLNKNIGIEGVLSYNRSEFTSEEIYVFNNTRSRSLLFNVGFQMYISKNPD